MPTQPTEARARRGERLGVAAMSPLRCVRGILSPYEQAITRHPPRQVTLCGSQMSGMRHVCAFFNSREQYVVPTACLGEGIAGGGQVITIVEAEAQAEHSSRLPNGGIDVQEAVKRQQLKLLASEDTYLQGGTFAVDRMWKMLEPAVREAEQSAVVCAHSATWNGRAQNCGGTDDLITYEAKVNLPAPHRDCTVYCAFDLNRISGFSASAFSSAPSRRRTSVSRYQRGSACAPRLRRGR